MTTPGDQPAPGRRRVRPYAMTGGRTRPTHDDLEIEALVATTATGQRAPKLTVEQRATRSSATTCCRSPRSLPGFTRRWASPGSWSATWPTCAWSSSTGLPGLATVPTWPCCTPSDGRLLQPVLADRRRIECSRTGQRPLRVAGHVVGWSEPRGLDPVRLSLLRGQPAALIGGVAAGLSAGAHDLLVDLPHSAPQASQAPHTVDTARCRSVSLGSVRRPPP
jgi:hypothetical protein